MKLGNFDTTESLIYRFKYWFLYFFINTLLMALLIDLVQLYILSELSFPGISSFSSWLTCCSIVRTTELMSSNKLIIDYSFIIKINQRLNPTIELCWHASVKNFSVLYSLRLSCTSTAGDPALCILLWILQCYWEKFKSYTWKLKFLEKDSYKMQY